MVIAANLIVAAPPARAAETAAAQISAATRLYVAGQVTPARQALRRLLAGPEARQPAVRAAALGTLLDICLHTQADACIAEAMQPYLDAVGAAPGATGLLRRETVRRADYYLAYGRFRLGSPAVRAGILDGEAWRHENVADAPLYLQRQVLAMRILLAQDRPAQAVDRIDRILSLVAALKNPQADRYGLASVLSDTIAGLLEVGDTERAWGVYRASHGFIAAALPAAGLDAATFRQTEAWMLQQMGDLAGAAASAEAALAAFDAMDLEPAVKADRLARALTQRAILCAVRADLACAHAAIGRHPAAGLYTQPGRVPADDAEVAYLETRAFIGALEGRPDPVAAAALQAVPAVDGDARHAAERELDRAAGLAFALPPGAARRAAILTLGARSRAVAERNSGVFGAWYRPGALDYVLIATALSEVEAPGADPDTSFALFQLANRGGASFDADALTVLGQARTALERRAIHQALRLRARRDRFEREHIAAVARRALATPPDGTPLGHDPGPRLLLRAFNQQIAQAGQGVTASGANLVPLQRFQALLQPDEAALSVAPGVGGLIYACVRRDSVTYARATVDLAQAGLDTRLLQLALTSTNAPDESLDAQFPVAAATRLYDVYVRPFAPCLKPGDHLLWLASVSTLNLPLSVLLEHAPPRTGAGYDLAQADWLVRHYVISYPGSAAMVVAARAGGARPPAAFDFLGVGDPILTAASDATPRRAELAALPPLPETRAELQASASGFRTARLLLQDKASEAGFRRELVGAYRYLSFATHGLMRNDIAALAEPALVMTPGAAGDPTDDGLLTASEIADLNLAARFVALSACNTANFGLDRVAQDLPALASAFAVAGTPATLATLWPVNSETGKRVVSATFGALHDAAGAPARRPRRWPPPSGRFSPTLQAAPTCTRASGRRSSSSATAPPRRPPRPATARRSSPSMP